MKIQKGFEAEYSAWIEKRKKEPHGSLMANSLHSAGDYLDAGGPVKDALQMVLQLKRSRLSSADRAQVALAVTIFSARGIEFRFEWNRYYCGEDWALQMEASEKRLYNPA